MDYQVGDKVIHWLYGMGDIIQIDEKVLSGHKNLYYVVQIRDLTLWVPVNEAGKRSLRMPTPGSGFEKLFATLRSQIEPLSDDRLVRRTQLLEKMKIGTLESICRVIRDLSFFARTKKLNDNDKFVLERARELLFNEWKLSLSVSFSQAEDKLEELLGEAL